MRDYLRNEFRLRGVHDRVEQAAEQQPDLDPVSSAKLPTRGAEAPLERSAVPCRSREKRLGAPGGGTGPAAIDLAAVTRGADIDDRLAAGAIEPSVAGGDEPSGSSRLRTTARRVEGYGSRKAMFVGKGPGQVAKP